MSIQFFEFLLVFTDFLLDLFYKVAFLNKHFPKFCKGLCMKLCNIIKCLRPFTLYLVKLP